MSKDLYYIQDSRNIVGNDLIWWGHKGNGYVCSILLAGVYSKDEAVRQHEQRHTDIPWPKSYIDKHIKPVVDHQNVEIKAALRGTGIKIKKYKEFKARFRCCHCGSFQTEYNYYTGCTRCGNDNMP